MGFLQKWNEQKVQKALNQFNEKPKYKAIYKSLHSGKTKYDLIYEPNAIESFLLKGDGIWERYVLTCIVELNEDENYES